MKKQFAFHIMALLFGVILLYQSAWATMAYVTDISNINMRSGPGSRKRVIGKVPSGSGVELIKQENGWSQIRYTREGGEITEGWILDRYLVTQPPWEARAEALEKENASLKEQVAVLSSDKANLGESEKKLADELQTTQEKLKELEAEFAALKSGSADYIKLRDEYRETKSALAAAQENVHVLSQEAENLRLSQTIKWFMAGAAVLILGWLIGLTMGRYQKKRRSSFHM